MRWSSLLYAGDCNINARICVGNGMGRLMSIRLAKMGCKLVLWDINDEGNQETASEIRKFGGHATTYTVDLSNREDVYTAADKVGTAQHCVTIVDFDSASRPLFTV